MKKLIILFIIMLPLIFQAQHRPDRGGGGGSVITDSSFVKITTDTSLTDYIIEKTAGAGVTIEGLRIEHDTITGDEIYLVGNDEDNTPTRNLGQNDDGEVVYMNVVSGEVSNRWQDSTVTLVDSYYKSLPIFADVHNNSLQNVTILNDSTLRIDVDWSGLVVFSISARTSAANECEYQIQATSGNGGMYARRHHSTTRDIVTLFRYLTFSQNDVIRFQIRDASGTTDYTFLSSQVAFR